MESNEKIRTGFSRVAGALAKKPAFGLGTGVSTTTIRNGLTCEVREGDWRFTIDMPEQAGGNAAGPAPGVHGRAALGSCLAIGYMMRAAMLNVSIRGLEVEIQADYDDGALFGTSPDTPPGYTAVRYTVIIDSDAPEEAILQMINEADRHSPYLDVFSRAQECQREIRINKQKKD